MEIECAAEKGDRFLVKLHMRRTDRWGLLSDAAKAISDTGTDIQHADMGAQQGGMADKFVVEVRDLNQLKKMLKQVGRLKGVISVVRWESFEAADLVEA